MNAYLLRSWLVYLLQKNINFFARFRVSVVSVLFALTLPGCLPRKCCIHYVSVKKHNIPLFVQLPENKFIFDNLTPLIYEALTHQFNRAGYCLVNNPDSGYLFKTTVCSLEPETKFVSPDVLLFHVRLKIVLLCEIFDMNGNRVTAKSFQGTTLISKPINPILKSDFFYFEYKRLLERMAPAIEHYFRPILMKIFEK